MTHDALYEPRVFGLVDLFLHVPVLFIPVKHLHSMAWDPLSAGVMLGRCRNRIQVVGRGGRIIRQLECRHHHYAPVAMKVFENSSEYAAESTDGAAEPYVLCCASPWCISVYRLACGGKPLRKLTYGLDAGFHDEEGTRFGRIAGFAIDPVHQRYYVCDDARLCVRVLSSLGEPLFSFGGPGDLPGEFRGLADITIDPIDNQVYVADDYHHRVSVFDMDGTFRHHFAACFPTAILVHPATREIVISSQRASFLQVCNLHGTYLRQYGGRGLQFNNPTHMAWCGRDQTHLAVADMGNDRIQIIPWIGQDARAA